jgi:hypothetical protein
VDDVRDLLGLDGMSDMDVMEKFITWDVLVVQHPPAIAEAIELDGFLTVPSDITAGLATAFHRFLRVSGLLKDWGRSYRYVSDALQADAAAEQLLCD